MKMHFEGVAFITPVSPTGADNRGQLASLPPNHTTPQERFWVLTAPRYRQKNQWRSKAHMESEKPN